MDTYGFGIGAVIRPTRRQLRRLLQRLDRRGVLLHHGPDPAQVTDHYQLGRRGLRRRDADPTGGSVDATGLAGTGSRYSTSTTLSLALATGTDPSGVATTGNQVLRAPPRP